MFSHAATTPMDDPRLHPRRLHQSHPESEPLRRSSREHRSSNKPENVCKDTKALRQLPCVFACRTCQSLLGDSTSLVAAYSMPGRPGPSLYSVTSPTDEDRRTMVAVRATTRNVVQAEDGELSCVCGAFLGRAVDGNGYREAELRVLNGSFHLLTSTLIRYRLGVDAGVRLASAGAGEAEEEREEAGEAGEVGEAGEGDGDGDGGAVGAMEVGIGREGREGRRGQSVWDDTVRDTLMDLKRRVRALESNFTHHDRELTDHFNTIRTLESLLSGGTAQ